MTLPVAPAVRIWAATFVLLLATALPAAPLRAEADSDFSATVKVDATADTADKARDQARLDGQRRALAEIVARLSGAADAARIAKLDDKAITDMVESLDVANERMSAVHYVADYTFHFRPSKVRPLLTAAAPPPAAPEAAAAVAPAAAPGGAPGVAPGAAAARPAVVLPVYQEGGRALLWDDPNPWRDAWSRQPASDALTVPLGDIADVATIDAQSALAGRAAPLAAIARRNGDGEAVVAAATARRQDGRLAGLDVSVKRYRQGQPAGSAELSLAAQPGESDSAFLARAVAAVAARIAAGTAAPQVAAQNGPAGTLDATVPIGSLADWVKVQQQLSSLSAVRKIDLLWLTRQEARIAIHYTGSRDKLKAGLAAIDLDLAGNGPQWQLRRTGAASLH